MAKRDFISVLDAEANLGRLLDVAADLKANVRADRRQEPLRGKTLGMIFEKASTRTRVSFEVGMFQLGGHALNLDPNDLQLGRGETIEDTARVLSRYLDAIMYRAFSHEKMVALARHSTVPVINALDDLEHPCQILADLLTVREHKGGLKGLHLSYLGDGNNVCNSLLLGCALTGIDITVGCPPGYEPNAAILAQARSIAAASGSGVEIVHDPHRAVKGADVLYTDVWVSMGMEGEREVRERVFVPFQLNRTVLALAAKGAIVLHCLPAHRGLEITEDVIDGRQSVVLDQAENRLHVQKALLLHLLSG